MIFGFLWGGVQNYRIQNFTQRHTNQTLRNGKFQVYADQIKIKDNYCSFEALDLDNHHKIKCTYFIQKDDEKEKLRHLAGALVIEAKANFKEPELPTNENQFNYRNYLLSRNITQIAQITKIIKIQTKPAKISFWDRITHQVRAILNYKFEHLPTPLKNYAKALVLGIIDDDFQFTINQIRDLGLLYLFCLSGMHVYFIRNYFIMLLGFFKVPLEIINVLLLMILPIYLVIGGTSLSLSRAVWMVWLSILTTIFLERPFCGIECWSVVLLFQLLKYPLLFLSLGATLSYLMTFIILLSSSDKMTKLNFKLNCFSIPLILNSTYQWNLLTPALSLIIGYLFEKIIFPITFIGIIFLPTQQLANQLLNVMDSVFNKLSRIPTIITFGKMPLAVAFLIIFIMFWGEWQRSLKRKIFLIGMIYLGCWLMIYFPLKSEVVYFDIGQGDATLIRKAFHHQVTLIDTGGKPEFGRQHNASQATTVGQRMIANYLLSKGISKIDKLYLTHQDADHVGYMTSIGKQINYNKIYVPAGMEQLSSFQKRLQQLKNNNYQLIPITAGNSDSELKVLHPFKAGKGTNEDSLVLFEEIGGYHFLFMGDLDQKGELKVLEHYPGLKADILKAGHHGSKTSSNPKFINQVSPQLVIISAGRNNRYHHPNQETLHTLSDLQIPYLNTANSGMIKIEFVNQRINIKEWLKR